MTAEHILGQTSDSCNAILNSEAQLNSNYTIVSVYILLWLFSTVGLLFVATTIFYNTKLQAHPQLLIAYICMAEACMSYNALIQVVNPIYVTCYLGFDKVFAWTLFQNSTWRSTGQNSFQCATNLLCNSNALFFQFFQLLSLMLNTCLCFDLIATIQSPFKPAGSRAKIFYLISTVVPVIMVLIIHISKKATDGSDNCSSCIDIYNGNVVKGTMITGIGNYILSFVMSTYILVAIYSVIYAYRRLQRPGVSQEIRQMFLKKHYIYVGVFIVIWIIQLSQNYFQLFNPPSLALTDFRVTGLDHLSAFLGFRGAAQQQAAFSNVGQSANSNNSTIFAISAIMTFSTGIFLTIARMFEPLFRYILWVKYYQFYGDFYENEKGQTAAEIEIQTNALSSFLSSSLNVELVYILLESITTFSKKSQNENDKAFLVQMKNDAAKGNKLTTAVVTPIDMSAPLESVRQQVEMQRSVVRTLTLNQIQIKNVDKWDGVKREAEQQQEPQVSTINEEVRTTEYAPAIFQAIRKMDNITDEMVQKSLDTELNRTQVFKAKESAGKSGSFFFFSFDKQFLLKTMNDHEMDVFTNCLPQYYEHLQKYPDSLVARIYGVFTVRMEELVPVHILLMSNAAQAGKSIDYCFDLKGSEINREVKEKEITPGGTLKDQNLLKIMKSEVFLMMQKKDVRCVMNQIAHDIKFLAAHNIMDYSLLLIVETNPKWIEKMARKQTLKKEKRTVENPVIEELMTNPDDIKSIRQVSAANEPSKLTKDFEALGLNNRHKFISQNGKYIYHIAIIDYLQAFDIEKKAENLIKVWLYNREEYKISAVNPVMYMKRFFKFMRDHVVIDQKHHGGGGTMRLSAVRSIVF